MHTPTTLIGCFVGCDWISSGEIWVHILDSTLPEIIMEVDGMAPWITMFYIELIIWNQF